MPIEGLLLSSLIFSISFETFPQLIKYSINLIFQVATSRTEIDPKNGCDAMGDSYIELRYIDIGNVYNRAYRCVSKKSTEIFKIRPIFFKFLGVLSSCEISTFYLLLH